MRTTKLKVNTDNSKYSIIIGSGITNNLIKLIKNNSINFNKCLIVVDNKIPKKLINSTLKSLKKKKNYNSFI